MSHYKTLQDNTFHNNLLRDNLKKIFGEFDGTILNEIENQLVWLEVKGGETIIREGDVGDSLYFVLSGRLAATKMSSEGIDTKIGEIVRGETVGEMAIFTGESRYATVKAIRDSVLVQLSKNLFGKIISEYPEVSINVTRLIIERFKKTQKQHKNHTINISFLPIHETIQPAQIPKAVYEYCSQGIHICFVNNDLVKECGFYFGKEFSDDNSVESKKLIQWLNDLESQHEFMFFDCDPNATLWNKKCIRQADHIVLLADATKNFEVTEIELELLNMSNVNFSLALIHPNDTVLPQNTKDWLNARPLVNSHFHLRKNNEKDLKRMARILTGKATGLVLAGGGAKGFAHIGVMRALEEYDIPIDYVGGTSIGSMMAATIAFDKPTLEIEDIVYKATLHKPSSDLSFVPFISLVKGGNIKAMLFNTFNKLCGRTEIDLCDTWLPIYVIASNYSKSNQATFFRGNMLKILLASAAIPGVFPPVIIDGELFVDGGTFNNFPADIMRNIGMNKVIGVDFKLDKKHKLSIEEMPTNNEILRSKLFGKKDKKFRLPGIGSIIINSTLMYSSAKRQETIAYLDLHFNPDVAKYGLTAWTDFHKIVKKGYLHAREVLGNMSADQLAEYQKPI